MAKVKLEHAAGSYPERGQWARQVEFLLSMVGYTVGLGNIWRFPYLCMRNGGGAFLIPFLIFLVLCGSPLFFLEVSLGQFTGKGLLNVWSVSPLFKGIGMGMACISTCFALYYNTILAWIIYYLGNSFVSPLPWTTCNNWWNSPNCLSDRALMTNVSNTTMPDIGTLSANDSDMWVHDLKMNLSTSGNGTVRHIISATEDFWQNNVLRISNGIDDVGIMPLHLLGCFTAAWILICLCVLKGARSVGKVVYVTATAPYILLTVLLIRGLTLPGAVDGVLFYIKPDFGKLLSVSVWIEAALQVFFSLGATWGPLITMASYNKFKHNCLRDAVCIAFVGEGTSIFAGFVVFSIIGFMANEANVTVPEVMESGPGLVFIAYPEAISRLPFPNVWAVLFFLMLLTVGLDSQFGSIESVCCSLMDVFPKLQRHRVLSTVLTCCICFPLGLPLVCQNGVYVFQLIDWYIAALGPVIIGLLECAIFGWIYGARHFSRDIEMMIGRPVPILIRCCWCCITPIILVALLSFTMATYKPPTYGQYEYPSYAEGIGWMIALMSVIPIPIMMVHQLYIAKGKTFMQRLKSSIHPDPDNWFPKDKDCQQDYMWDYDKKISPVRAIKLNLFGK